MQKLLARIVTLMLVSCLIGDLSSGYLGAVLASNEASRQSWIPAYDSQAIVSRLLSSTIFDRLVGNQHIQLTLGGILGTVISGGDGSRFEGIYKAGQRPTKSEGLEALKDSSPITRYQGALICASYFYGDDVNAVYDLMSFYWGLRDRLPSPHPHPIRKYVDLLTEVIKKIDDYKHRDSKWDKGYGQSNPIEEIWIAYNNATSLKRLTEDLCGLIAGDEFQKVIGNYVDDRQEWADVATEADHVVRDFIARLEAISLAAPADTQRSNESDRRINSSC